MRRKLPSIQNLARQVLRIEPVQIIGNESAVPADEFAVEVDFPSPELFGLNKNYIPVDFRLIAVVGLVICLAGGEVDGAADLLIEENIAHCPLDMRVETQ